MDLVVEPSSARFEILSKLGEGSMGVVYMAHDRVREMRVALKTMRSVNAKSLYRFKREFRVLSELSHPNIVELYELISEGEEWLLSMELIEGQDFLHYVGAVDGTTGGTRDVHLPEQSRAPSASARTPSSRESRSSEDGTALDSSRDQSAVPASSEPGVASTATRPRHARPPVGQLVDLERLRLTLGQLASALSVLHHAQIIHRDLKPSNVMITKDGRLVLMDFGIVAELRAVQADPAQNTAVMGTPAYMAPEQGFGRPSSAAADWYAFGVMMYRALTGLMPFRGASAALLRAKRDGDPTPVSELVTDLPADLEALCSRLLSRRPQDRPSGDEVQACLGLANSPGIGLGVTPTRDTDFVGRERQLRVLHDAYAEVERGSPRLVEIRGPAGIGKSSLVRHFLREIDTGSESRRPLVVSARCHERETLPYKAIDEAIDTLCLYVNELDADDRGRLLPDDLGYLAQLFPVLSRLPESRASEVAGHAGPQEVRGRALTALRELFEKLGDRRPVVLHIEDLQWADSDSVPLLSALFDPPHTARLLIVVTVRVDQPDSPSARGAAFEALLDDLGSRQLSRRVSLGPLSSAEQRALIHQLAPQLDAPADLLERIERQTGGHPLLLCELTRSLAQPDFDTNAPLGLEDLLWRRVVGLPSVERRLLECMAVAGEPLPIRVLSAATGLSEHSRERAARCLALERLAQVARTTTGPWLDVYQAKIREAILDRIEPGASAEHALALALALERWGEGAPATLARLWRDAHAPSKAAHYYLEAGHNAASQLAFQRAGTLFGEAVKLARTRDFGPTASHVRSAGWCGLAQLARSTGASGELLADGDELARALEAEELTAELARVHYLLGCLLFPRGDLEGCARRHHAALQHAKRANSVELMARALGGLGDVEYMRGRMQSCEAHCREAVALSRAHGLNEVEVAHLALGASSRFYDGDLPGVKRYVRRTLDLAARIGDKRSETIAVLIGALRYLVLGRYKRAQSWNERFSELVEVLGIRHFRALAVLVSVELAIHAGQPERAQAEAAAGVAEAKREGHVFALAALFGAQAWASREPQTRREAIDAGLDSTLAVLSLQTTGPSAETWAPPISMAW